MAEDGERPVILGTRFDILGVEKPPPLEPQAVRNIIVMRKKSEMMANLKTRPE
jgi:hypothetical protein